MRCGFRAFRVYPRGCGEPAIPKRSPVSRAGLSPRVRGTRYVSGIGNLAPGSIPAGAGNPASTPRSAMTTRVYPRGCGEPLLAAADGLYGLGLSPRVRGTLVRAASYDGRRGSIPAGAGNPHRLSDEHRGRGVYPRGCGEPGDVVIAMKCDVGLSPRVRGTLDRSRRLPSMRGSIPAGAGNPGTRTRTGRTWRVYPRGCGEPISTGQAVGPAQGLSPRVRGTLREPQLAPIGRGSIPAGAGNPCHRVILLLVGRVYPRGCGEPVSSVAAESQLQGLSPRVRGTLQRSKIPTSRTRSIPAGAGNPTSTPRILSVIRVYPRGCGEPRNFRAIRRQLMGLSPRVRGTPERHRDRAELRGSIPAGAGNPYASIFHRMMDEVYPRGCGEPETGPIPPYDPGGLSPRVRGTLQKDPRKLPQGGSIPAGAGNPATPTAARWIFRVYPRGCGEPQQLSQPARGVRGLSPRVRGTPAPGLDHREHRGSIPAGAGNPRDRRRAASSTGVYPRGCGEPWTGFPPAPASRGLSPRVRGTLQHGAGCRRVAGSIPAGAGNPVSGATCRGAPGVYPRGCGEP